MELDAEILAHYSEGREHDRLTSAPSLELLRTQVLLERWLPAPPASVLDVGGGSGVYARWLAGRGYQVHLIDPVPLHRDQAAAAGGFSVAAGDARDLADVPGESYDAVLLLGPLYHLTQRADRVRALAEARRAARPGAVVAAAAISRYASFFDGFFRGIIDKPGFAPLLADDLRTGQHRNPGRDPGFFTTSYFHDRAALAAEVAEAGLQLADLVPVEGPLHWAPGIQDRLAEPEQRRLILNCLAAVERDPAMAGATAHLLAVGRRD